ncbi:ABC transporter permease [Intestinibacillus massiliensis]|uniref:ABC transporter permease n=1 Tax=Intestinibacillus massiliensis TaxID=1871029 RepID=UPI000B34B0B1|nr:ABC transporter permease [Intestinibacillus massiliensis]MCB6366839.1 ABC transporter permease [Intestinibacillus massiliensis]
MSITQTLAMAFKAIGNNKLRSFLTMLGIIIGVAAVITLVSVTQGQSQMYMMQMEAQGANRIDMYFYVNSSKARDAILDYAEKEVGKRIVAITPMSQNQVTLKYRTKNMNDVRISFGNEQYGLCTSNNISAGRDISKSDVKNRARVCVIGEAVRKNFFGAMSPIGQTIKIGNSWSQSYQPYTVIGVYNGKFGGKLNTDDQMVLVPNTLQMRIMGWEDNSSYAMRATDTDAAKSFTDDITAFANTKIDPNNDYFQAYANAQFQEQMQSATDQQSITMAIIAGISLLVGGIGIMNIMLVTVTERTREIGIRMAIGARRRDIIGQFLIEASVVSAIGGLFGIGLGYFGAAVLGNIMLAPVASSPWMPAAAADMVVSPSLPLVIGAFLFSVVLGIVFGIYPANKASKLQPVEALRTQ